jgi:hypothetical protein
MTQADFLLELLIIALDRQRSLARSTRSRNGMSWSTVASQNFVGATTSLGHSINSVSSFLRFFAKARFAPYRGRTHAYTGKA